MGASTRFHQLDGLRAIAVSAVVVHHIGGASLAQKLSDRGHSFLGEFVASSTASGVELFFVLSGIVLLRPYLRQGRPLDFGVYMRRRIQRLWPPFLAAWLLAGAVSWFSSAFPTEWTRGAGLSSFELGAWLAQVGIIYVGAHSYNAAWWSLNVEVLFYLLVPLLILLLNRSKLSRSQLSWAWVGSIAFAIASAIFLPREAVSNVMGPFWRLAVYASCFVSGILVAAYDIPQVWAKRLLVIGALYVPVSCAWPPANQHVAWGLVHLGLVVAAFDSRSRLARALSSWPFLWLGERSYSLFLVHISIFNLVNHLTTLFVTAHGAFYYVISRAIELPLALFVAMVVFSLVEKRFAHSLLTADAFWPLRRDADKSVTVPTPHVSTAPTVIARD